MSIEQGGPSPEEMGISPEETSSRPQQIPSESNLKEAEQEWNQWAQENTGQSRSGIEIELPSNPHWETDPNNSNYWIGEPKREPAWVVEESIKRLSMTPGLTMAPQEAPHVVKPFVAFVTKEDGSKVYRAGALVGEDDLYSEEYPELEFRTLEEAQRTADERLRYYSETKSKEDWERSAFDLTTGTWKAAHPENNPTNSGEFRIDPLNPNSGESIKWGD